MKRMLKLTPAVLLTAALGYAGCSSKENATPRPEAPTNAASNSGDHGDAHTKRLEGADLARAKTLFTANCAKCHTESGKGDPHHAKHNIPDFTKAAWHEDKTDAGLTESITNGKGKEMPAFKDKLSNEKIALLVHYVHEFPNRASAEPTPPSSKTAVPAPKAKPTAKAPSKPASKPSPKPKEDHSGHGGHP